MSDDVYVQVALGVCSAIVTGLGAYLLKAKFSRFSCCCGCLVCTSSRQQSVRNARTDNELSTGGDSTSSSIVDNMKNMFISSKLGSAFKRKGCMDDDTHDDIHNDTRDDTHPHPDHRSILDHDIEIVCRSVDEGHEHAHTGDHVGRNDRHDRFRARGHNGSRDSSMRRDDASGSNMRRDCASGSSMRCEGVSGSSMRHEGVSGSSVRRKGVSGSMCDVWSDSMYERWSGSIRRDCGNDNHSAKSVHSHGSPLGHAARIHEDHTLDSPVYADTYHHHHHFDENVERGTARNHHLYGSQSAPPGFRSVPVMTFVPINAAL